MNPYSLGLVVRKGSRSAFLVSVVSKVMMRPSRILTDVEDRGLATLTGLHIGNCEQLCASVDFYDWSVNLCGKLDREFLLKHGLAGKSGGEIQAWLDARDTSMPSHGVGRLTLPTIEKGSSVRIRGRVGDVPVGRELNVSIVGWALQ
jgi:hypothetical protein